jgi:hypothetical protein
MPGKQDDATISLGGTRRATTSWSAPPTRSGKPQAYAAIPVAMSLTDLANPYRMEAIQGRVVEARSDEGCRYMDPYMFRDPMCSGTTAASMINV